MSGLPAGQRISASRDGFGKPLLPLTSPSNCQSRSKTIHRRSRYGCKLHNPSDRHKSIRSQPISAIWVARYESIFGDAPENGFGRLAHYNGWVCPKVRQGVRWQWVAATACAAALALIPLACSENPGSPTPPTPTPPTPPPVVVNTPPVIESITVSHPRAEPRDDTRRTTA